MCVREVASYRRQSPPDIAWWNLAEPELSIPCDPRGFRPEPEALMRRFHVYTADGQWLHGAPAFAVLWSRLGAPWRVLAGIARLPGGLWMMDAVYALFLRLRPALQRFVRHLVVPDALPAMMIPALRSDHAGETGAVWIYRAMLALNRDAGLRPLLEAHIDQEKEHLATFDTLLPWRCRSRLLPFWRLAGAFTGAVAGLAGRRGMLATIAAVERFVDRHYLEQIEQLEALIDPEQIASPACATGACGPSSPADHAELLHLLKAFRDDECRHRDEALQALDEGAAGDTGRALKVWCDLVERGSAIAVKAARAI